MKWKLNWNKVKNISLHPFFRFAANAQDGNQDIIIIKSKLNVSKFLKDDGHKEETQRNKNTYKTTSIMWTEKQNAHVGKKDFKKKKSPFNGITSNFSTFFQRKWFNLPWQRFSLKSNAFLMQIYVKIGNKNALRIKTTATTTKITSTA